MAVVRERERQLFPLNNIAAVVRFFRWQLEDNCEPNLALLSIVIGAVENSLTCGRCDAKPVEIRRDAAADLQSSAFPVVDLLTVESLYLKFHAQIKGSVDLSRLKTDGFASRELVKRVSDVIWGSLARNCYKDKAHLRSLYSYLTRNKLDCFGVACAVVAACQVLKFNDVHLALSEDHAWLTFGKDGQETAEVTWHGKGNEDKRGQPVPCGVGEKSWLYLNGHPVRLTRQMEVAALISGMNPSIGLNSDSLELGTLQQELLWLLHDLGHLERYPMALGTLGDLEAICPLPGRISPSQLYREAIESSRVHYHNQHVYPYTFYGRYLYGNQRYKEAIAAWADATDVIRHYNYNREDEEVYKEFLEIANELIPCMIKLESAAEAGVSSSSCILRDAECFAHLLRFYDGICQWEEGSSTPVLHIGWAKPLVNTISKFDAKVRSMVEICIDSVQGEAKDEGCDTRRSDTVNDSCRHLERKQVDVTVTVTEMDEDRKRAAADDDAPSRRSTAVRKRNANNNNRRAGCAVSSGPPNSEFIKSLENQMNPNDAPPHPNIAALAAACGENILNPEYLLGSGEPFTAPKSTSSTTAPILGDTDVKLLDCRDLLSSRSNATPFPGMTMDSMLKAEIPDDLLQGHMMLQATGDGNNNNNNQGKADSTQKQLSPAISAKVALRSEKMKGLKELLLSEKLNTSAIQLQLTAQSQVQVVRRNKVFREYEFVGGGAVAAAPGSRASKRTRKD